MIPWETLDTAPIPGGSGMLRLKRRGGEFSIMLGSNELMNSRLSGSEEALARLTIERLAAPAPRLLVGGLGLGFTLRACLPLLPPAARVTVAELVPAVVAWARGPLAALHGGSLDDPRVEIVEGDVGAAIRAARGRWDAILLDVDNGPEGLSRAGNDALYGGAGEDWLHYYVGHTEGNGGAGDGTDRYFGGAGSDNLVLTSARDLVYGGLVTSIGLDQWEVLSDAGNGDGDAATDFVMNIYEDDGSTLQGQIYFTGGEFTTLWVQTGLINIGGDMIPLYGQFTWDGSDFS